MGGMEDVKLITGKMDIDEVERESLRPLPLAFRWVEGEGKGKGLGGLRVRDFPVLQRFVRPEPREPSSQSQMSVFLIRTIH